MGNNSAKIDSKISKSNSELSLNSGKPDKLEAMDCLDCLEVNKVIIVNKV